MGFEVLPYHNLVTIVAWSNEQMDRFRGKDGGRGAEGRFAHIAMLAQCLWISMEVPR